MTEKNGKWGKIKQKNSYKNRNRKNHKVEKKINCDFCAFPLELF